MAELDYVFREKIRHPSNPSEWIIARDYGPINEITDTATSQTVTATQFYVKAKSYNYTATSNNQWINNIDIIDKNSIEWPEGTNKELIDNSLSFIGINTISPAPTVTISDIIKSNYSFNGIYNDSSTTTPASIIIKDDSHKWNETFITQEISTTLTNNHIKDNDILVIPAVDINNKVSLSAYEVQSRTASSVTTNVQIDFSYNNINDKNESYILNMVDNDINNNHNIKLTDMLNQCQTINSFTFDADGFITSMKDNQNNSINNFNSYNLYGNGIILNRFILGSSLSDISTNYDYTWFMVHSINDTNMYRYILQLEYDTSSGTTGYRIKKLIRVNVVSNSSYVNDLYLEASMTVPSSEYNNLTLYMGWGTDSYSGNLIGYEKYKIFNGCIVPSASITVTNSYFNTDTKVKNKIKNNYSEIPNSVTPTISIDNGGTIKLYANNTLLNTITYSVNNNVYTGTINVINNNINSTVTLTGNSDNLSVQMTNNTDTHFLEKWWDYIIEQNNITAYDNIDIIFYFSSKTGAIKYENTISSAYTLELLGSSNGNIDLTINNLWDNIRIVKNEVVSDISKIVILYNNAENNETVTINYPKNNMIYSLGSGLHGKVWFLDGTAHIASAADENDTTTKYISVNDLKITEKFMNLIKNIYTDIEINITIPANTEQKQYQDITYQLYKYANGIRYYDHKGNLLNLGGPYKPVYIKDGQFVECNDIRDIFIHNTDQPDYNAGLWIDPDGA